MAALSSPSMLAARFIIMEPVTGWFFGISGISLWNNGPTSFAIIFTTPPFSPIFINPSQRVITPVRPKEISKPVLAISKVLPIISVKISTSPKKRSLIKPITKATIKKSDPDIIENHAFIFF